MKKKVCLILATLCLLLTACEPTGGVGPASESMPGSSAPVPEGSPAPEETPVTELSERAQMWSADLNYLKRNYKQYHTDPFYFCSEEEFNWKIDQLAAKIDDLTDDDIYFELKAIIAGMGDTHSTVVPPDCIYDRLFPVLIWCFGDRVYMNGYLEGYEEFKPYLLQEIVAVNCVDITYLRQKAGSLYYPTNSWSCKELFPTLWCFLPAFFDWAGCDYREGYTFQILNENREVESVEIPVISLEEYTQADAVYPENWEFIALTSFDDNWTEYFEGQNGGYIYLSIGQMENLTVSSMYYQELFEKTTHLIEKHPDCGKLVIDLRWNPGGAISVHNDIWEGVQMLKKLSIEQVFVITGGYTASAAIDCLAMFKEELDAVMVGEPTGQFPSFFYHAFSYGGMVFNLPQSQISVQVSTGWYDGLPIIDEYYDENGKLYEWENTVLPDVFVYQDIEDIRQGKDSVIEWILAQ